MELEIFLKDSVKYYFKNLHQKGEISKSTVIGSAILTILMSKPRKIDGHYDFRIKTKNYLDKVTIKFHTKVDVSEQQALGISQIIEKSFLKELKDFTDIYRSLSDLKRQEIVCLFFKKHNIPDGCVYDQHFYFNYLRTIHLRRLKSPQQIQIPT